MDHIPQPLNCDRDRIVVPYLADQAPRYDGQGFESFPLRCSYSVVDGNHTSHNENHRNVTAYSAFLQSWLWFGLLQEVLQTAISRQAFIRLMSSGEKVLSTESLLAYISAARAERRHDSLWYDNRKHHAKKPDQDGHESPEELRVRTVLAFALRSCEEIDRTMFHDEGEIGLILLSIRILIETLSGLLTDEDCLPLSTMQLDLCSFRPLCKRMLSKPEMCRPRLEAMFRSVKSRPYTSLAYLSSLRRHELPWQTHVLCEEIGACKAFDIDEATFNGLHVTPGCRCKNVGAPRHQMLAILRDGGMPGMRYREKNNKGRLEYFRISSASRYIAISHLWSSGLGNLRSNDLPRCQLERILQLLRKVKPFFDHLEFWLDIYCIPVVQIAMSSEIESEDAAEIESLKLKALAWMPATYSWAHAVLVLDHELGCVPSGADAVEILTSVHASGWNSRYWTWQEHELARRIVYQVGDSFVDASALQRQIFKADERVRDSSSWLTRLGHYFRRGVSDNRLWRSGPSGFTHVQRRSAIQMRSAGHQHEDFVSLWNTLTNRRTTKWQDALSIMGNLIGHRASQMAVMQPKDQMKALIKARYTLPFHFLTIRARRYGRGSDKNDQESAWIPRSPMDAEPMRLHLPLLVREDGLVLRLHHSYDITVVSFTSTTTISGRTVFELGNHSGKVFAVVPEVSSEIDLDLEPLSQASEHLLVLEALVFGTMCPVYNGRGCLLRVVNRSSQTIHVTYCFAVTWTSDLSRPHMSNASEEKATVKDARVMDMQEQAIKFDCDISSWPDLIDFKHTDVAESWSRARRQTTRILTWFSVCVLTVSVTSMTVFIFALREEGNRPELVYEPGIVLTVLALSIVWTVLAIPIRFVEWVQGHLLFEFARPDYDPGLKKWQRLRRAIPSEKWTNLSWRSKMDTFWLYIAVGIVYLMEGIVTVLNKATSQCLTRPDSESQVDHR